MLAPFNATVSTTFFGFHRTNVDFVLTNETIHDRHVVAVEGDIVRFNVSGCDQPSRKLGAIIYCSTLAMICLLSFLLQLILFPLFWKMAKTHGPSFYFLLAMVGYLSVI
jgi:hypothetical protein